MCSLSLGGLAGPVKAAGSSVRVGVWVIRSPGTLRWPVKRSFAYCSPSWFGRVLACFVLRFFGLDFCN